MLYGHENIYSKRLWHGVGFTPNERSHRPFMVGCGAPATDYGKKDKGLRVLAHRAAPSNRKGGFPGPKRQLSPQVSLSFCSLVINYATSKLGHALCRVQVDLFSFCLGSAFFVSTAFFGFSFPGSAEFGHVFCRVQMVVFFCFCLQVAAKLQPTSDATAYLWAPIPDHLG